jgi:hypothetical protein
MTAARYLFVLLFCLALLNLSFGLPNRKPAGEPTTKPFGRTAALHADYSTLAIRPYLPPTDTLPGTKPAKAEKVKKSKPEKFPRPKVSKPTSKRKARRAKTSG